MNQAEFTKNLTKLGFKVLTNEDYVHVDKEIGVRYYHDQATRLIHNHERFVFAGFDAPERLLEKLETLLKV